jgi:hypothetical protein
MNVFLLKCYTKDTAVSLSAAASKIVVLLTTGWIQQKLLPTVIAAEVEHLSIPFGMESGCFVYCHPANGVFGHNFRCNHGHGSFLVVVVALF